MNLIPGKLYRTKDVFFSNNIFVPPGSIVMFVSFKAIKFQGLFDLYIFLYKNMRLLAIFSEDDINYTFKEMIYE